MCVNDMVSRLWWGPGLIEKHSDCLPALYELYWNRYWYSPLDIYVYFSVCFSAEASPLCLLVKWTHLFNHRCLLLAAIVLFCIFKNGSWPIRLHFCIRGVRWGIRCPLTFFSETSRTANTGFLYMLLWVFLPSQQKTLSQRRQSRAKLWGHAPLLITLSYLCYFGWLTMVYAKHVSTLGM